MTRRPPRSTLFPYTTSSDLHGDVAVVAPSQQRVCRPGEQVVGKPVQEEVEAVMGDRQDPGDQDDRDRKSTRLNSSHTVISYAVFCLKKKKTDRDGGRR